MAERCKECRGEVAGIIERARAAARLAGLVGLYDYETRSSPYGPGRYGLEYRVLLPQSKRPAERGVIFETGNLTECVEWTRLAMEEFRRERVLLHESRCRPATSICAETVPEGTEAAV